METGAVRGAAKVLSLPPLILSPPGADLQQGSWIRQGIHLPTSSNRFPYTRVNCQSVILVEVEGYLGIVWGVFLVGR